MSWLLDFLCTQTHNTTFTIDSQKQLTNVHVRVPTPTFAPVSSWWLTLNCPPIQQGCGEIGLRSIHNNNNNNMMPHHALCCTAFMLTLIAKQHNTKIDLDSVYSCIPLHCILASGHQKNHWKLDIFTVNATQCMVQLVCKMGLLSVLPLL